MKKQRLRQDRKKRNNGDKDIKISAFWGEYTAFSKPFYFVLFISLVILISHTFYVLKTFAYPEWDEHRYMGAAIHFLTVFQHPNIYFLQKLHAVQEQWLPATPPLYPFILDIPLLLVGTYFAYKISIWLNVVFYIGTVVGVYALGEEFFSKKVSTLTASIFAFYGFPLFYLNFVYTETAGAAFTIWALYFLAKSNNFQNSKRVILFGLLTAFAALTRWTTPLFILGSFLVLIVISLKQASRKLVLKNVLIFLACCLIPLIVYYIPNHEAFIFYLQSAVKDSSSWVPVYLRNPFSTHSFIWYLSTLAQLTIFFYLLFLSGFFISVFTFKKVAFLLGAFLIPFIFFTFFSTFKDDRFIVPLYPSVALLSGIVFDFIEKRKWAFIFNGLVTITLIISSLNFLGTSWGIGPMKFSTNGNWKTFTLPNSVLVPMPVGHARRVWLTPISWPPRSDEGRVDSIIHGIVKDWHKKTAPRVLSTFEMSQINTALYSKVTYEQLDILSLYDLAGIKNGDYQTFFSNIKNADYILVKNGIFDKGIPQGKSLEWDSFIPFVRIFNKVKDKGVLPGAFIPIANISIPFDKSMLTIYKKVREVKPNEWKDFGSLFEQVDPDHGANIESAIQDITYSYQ